jgi:hypothetical protein
MRVEQLYHRRRQLSDKCQRCVGKEFRAGGDADWFFDLSRLSFLALGAHPQCRISAPRSSPLFPQNPGISRTNQGKAGCATSSHCQPRIGNQQWHIHLPAFHDSISTWSQVQGSRSAATFYCRRQRKEHLSLQPCNRHDLRDRH